MFRTMKIFLLLVLLPTIAGATDYYVDTNNGNNSWNGLFPTYADDNNGPKRDPWEFNSVLDAGDTLYFRAGTYNVPSSGHHADPYIKPTAHNGLSGSPITYTCYGGENVTIVGDNDADGSPCIGSYDKSWVVIDNLKIHGTATFSWGSYNCTIQNCEIWDAWNNPDENWELIRANEADDLRIYNNILRDNPGSAPNTCAVKLYQSENIIIENNEVYGTITGFFDKGHNINTIIRYNIFHNLSEYGVVLYGSTYGDCDQPKVYQNIFYDCSNSAITIWGSTTQVDAPRIYNNTIYNCSDSTDDGGILHRMSAENTNDLQYWNNIICNGDYFYTFWWDCTGDITYSNYNNFFNESQWVYRWNANTLTEWKDLGHDSHSILTDPSFVNAAEHDFHLQANSPCIGTGKDGVNMGCYITGHEIIGPVPEGGARPGPPPNFR